MPRPSPIPEPSRSWAHQLKPAASRRTQILAAAFMWSLVGSGLAAAGSIWTWGSCAGLTRPALLALSVAAGLAKGHFVLRKTARRIRARIETRGDGRCLGGFLSWKGWLLVATMMAGGRLLRTGHLPGWVIGPLYLAVGTALLSASATFWRGR